MDDIVYASDAERNPLSPAPLREPKYIKMRKTTCYMAIVAAGVLFMCLTGVCLIFAVRPGILAGGLPKCGAQADFSTLSSVWTANRARLVTLLPAQMRDNGLLLVSGAQEPEEDPDELDVVFEQNTAFMYLTGSSLPDCLLVLEPDTGRSVFFLSPLDPVWDGRAQSNDEWAKELGVTQVLPVEELQGFLSTRQAKVLLTMSPSDVPDYWNGTVDATELPNALQASRLVKTAPELELMATLSRVSGAAHLSLMHTVTPQGTEYAVYARLLSSLMACECGVRGYAPIVGAGYNSALLHYTANNAAYQAGDLILIDAAASYSHYTSDMTRTLPVNGRFTTQQAAIYQAVLDAQNAAAVVCKSGVSFTELREAARASLLQSLVALGLLSTMPPKEDAEDVKLLFMPHGLSHSVGLTVHDTSNSLPAALVEDMVITIEPGIYFNEAVFTDAAFAAHPEVSQARVQEFLSASFGGVRIEDAYRVTKDRCLQLTDAPKSIEAIEAAMKK